MFYGVDSLSTHTLYQWRGEGEIAIVSQDSSLRSERYIKSIEKKIYKEKEYVPRIHLHRVTNSDYLL